VIFDLDGVVTSTARVHARAWQKMFDQFLAQRRGGKGEDLRPFDLERDYPEHLDGKPRYQGAQSFLQSRGIDLPWGDAGDPPERETVCGLGNRKNRYFRRSLREEGVAPYSAAVELIRGLRERGAGVAVISASRNAEAVLEAAGVRGLFHQVVDGVETGRLGLAGKPAPDVFLEAARRLGVPPARAAVVEDALAGVEAGRAGGFGLVVGVDRSGRGRELAARGADVVVESLAELEA
jgi:alpha,alpha-trehalase